MIVGVADGRIVRRRGERVELLDLAHGDVGEALRAGADADALASAAALREVDPGLMKLQAPVDFASAVWAVGLSYREHASEAGVEHSADEGLGLPALFLKASSSIAGPDADIVLPLLAPTKVDYEGEIAVIVGREGREIPVAQGWDHVFAVTAANDVSARDVQQGQFFGGIQDPSKAKSFDSFTPLGPWLVTPDEFPDRDAIGLRTLVNGDVRQAARTSELLRPIPAIVAAVSRFTTLRPGDVILTGTPAGVGMASGRYLAPGDEVVVEVDIAGALRNRVVAPHRGEPSQ
jgi:2-keto-4-pentenoate hydratase/2-oxohepta-3-ene-1,7-dioic acid hydratase in catechol pathway